MWRLFKNLPICIVYYNLTTLFLKKIYHQDVRGNIFLLPWTPSKKYIFSHDFMDMSGTNIFYRLKLDRHTRPWAHRFKTVETRSLLLAKRHQDMNFPLTLFQPLHEPPLETYRPKSRQKHFPLYVQTSNYISFPTEKTVDVISLQSQRPKRIAKT